MNKQQVLGIGGLTILASLMLAKIVGVSQSALIQFMYPTALLIISVVCIYLYFYQEDYSTTGVLGVCTVGFGLLWLMSLGLWQSWAYGGGDGEWIMLAEVNNLRNILPKPKAIHSFVFEQPFFVSWCLVGMGLIVYGTYLILKGRR